MDANSRTPTDGDRSLIAVASEAALVRGAFASVLINLDDHTQHERDWHALHEDERTLASAMIPERRVAFAAGRHALRAALAHIDPTQGPPTLLSSSRGAPRLPPGFSGSISHKRTRAVAVAADLRGTTEERAIGIDLEHRPTEADTARPSIAKRVLTPYERDALLAHDALVHREKTLIYFALKEAVYKSIDPFVQRYVHFTEVELDLHDNGEATVRLLLPDENVANIAVHAHWRMDDAWIVAIASSTLSDRDGLVTRDAAP